MKQTIHKRSQLNEDDSQVRLRNSNMTGLFHHQNPFVLPSLIEASHVRSKSLHKKRGIANKSPKEPRSSRALTSDNTNQDYRSRSSSILFFFCLNKLKSYI